MIAPFPENFKLAVAYVLSNEGGFVNHPKDKGGPTNFGITLIDLSRFLGRACTAFDVQDMTVDQAVGIYYTDFWCPSGLDPLQKPFIPTAIFDTGILYGMMTAVKLAQDALNCLGTPILIDGLMGPRTCVALDSCDPKIFIDVFHDRLLTRIATLTKDNPNLQIFGPGWLDRANKLLTLV